LPLAAERIGATVTSVRSTTSGSQLIRSCYPSWLKTVKDTQGRYIGGGPTGPAITQIWGRNAVGTVAQPIGTFLVGAFYDGAQIFDRQTISVLLSTEDGDNFVKNLVTVLCEERVAMTVRRPAAFITGTFPSA
jgi:HK97 family phage major capsid protein